MRPTHALGVVLVVFGCGSSSSTPDSGVEGGATDASPSTDASDAQSTADASDAPAVGPSCSGCPPPTTCGGCWQPPASARWQYQLEGTVDTSITGMPYGATTSVAPDVFDIDLYASDGTTPDSAATSALHTAGHHALCYVDAGTYENFRPDAADYTTFDSACSGCLLGASNGWPGEQWLNINDDMGQRTFILGELGKRIDKCVAAGFDGVELDNVDAYANTTGFTISAATQELFDASIANLVHGKGLSVALKNDVDQATDLEPYFDYTVNEQCFEYMECSSLMSFTAAGKAIFNVEYNLTAAQFCAQANTANIDSIVKTLALDATPWTPCR